MKKRINLLILFMVCGNLIAQDLERRALWQASFSAPKGTPGAKIILIEPGSPLEKSGLQSGDLILRVDDRLADSGENWTSITYSIRANSSTRLLVRRGESVFEKNVTLVPIPLEEHSGIDTYYEEVISDYGIRQRMIITKPKEGIEKMPAVVMLGGLSCSTLELYPGRDHNWAKMIREIVEDTDMVVMRLEKPGVGDSEGDCARTDFQTELEGYRAAIRALKSKNYVDTSNIVVYGSSMGSTLAPLFANEFNLAGVVSDGTFFKTWFEHMLEIERRLRQMQGDDESTIARKMNTVYIPLYYGMLIEKKSYQDIIKEYPAIAEYNYHSPNHMYGRPLAYYQQLQDYDLAGEWEKIKVPVRILYGMNDWIMTEFDNNMIINILERVDHEDHELVKYPGLDHWNTIHKTPEDSFFGRPGKWDPDMAKLVIRWLKEMVE